MSKKNLKNKTRLQFDFSPEMLVELEELKTLRGSSSRAESIRRAIKVDLRMAKMEKEGGRVIYREKDGKELAFLFI